MSMKKEYCEESEIKELFKHLDHGTDIDITVFDGPSGRAKVLNVREDKIQVEFYENGYVMCYACTSLPTLTLTLKPEEIYTIIM